MKFRLFGSSFTANAVQFMPPGQAKWWGRNKLTMDRRQQIFWNRKSRYVMEVLCRQKFEDHPELKQSLLDTTGIIVEENWWHDNIWGHCICPKHYWLHGLNQLGYVLMNLRKEFGGIGIPKPTWENYG